VLERFAEKVAQMVLTEFEPTWVRVRVAKLGALAGVKEVGVEIERSRDVT
jgi:dihydroneopterin aldolase